MRRLIDRDDTLKIIADTISLYGTGTKVESEILSIVGKIPSAEQKMNENEELKNAYYSGWVDAINYVIKHELFVEPKAGDAE